MTEYDKYRCRYDDCVEGHPLVGARSQTTCPTCRESAELSELMPEDIPDYPEHDKLQVVKDRSQAIGAFLDWLTGEKGYTLAIWGEDNEYKEERLFPRSPVTNDLLAEYFDIDQDLLEAEKQHMLDALREAQERG